MVKKFMQVCVGLGVAYLILIQVQIFFANRDKTPYDRYPTEARTNLKQQVYSFSFSKYDTNGMKELEIEGDTADIQARQIFFTNVLAKAYAEESPITITADGGIFDKVTGNVHL